MNHYIGFDMGGTKMISAVLDEAMTILSRHRVNTDAEEGAEASYGRVVEAITGSLAAAGVERASAIGLAVPGLLDRGRGVILNTPNMSFHDFPMATRLSAEFDAPVVLENDVNAGIFGEYCAGAARGFRHVVGIFIGTGIGGGLVLDGRLYRGATGNAGEVGHLIIQPGGPLCGCGRRGCVEALASRMSIAKDLAQLAGSGKGSTTLNKLGTDIKKIKSGAIAKAVEKEEPQVLEVVRRAAHYVGVAMAHCVNLLSPEVVVLGGGLIEKLGDAFLEPARWSMREHAMDGLWEGVQVVTAALGDDAVTVGAAALAREAHA